jgi:hypothetical protein
MDFDRWWIFNAYPACIIGEIGKRRGKGEPMMKQLPLGRSGLLVSRTGLGCMGMSEFYGPGDERESIRTIHRALEVVLTPKDLSRMDRAFPAGSAPKGIATPNRPCER